MPMITYYVGVIPTLTRRPPRVTGHFLKGQPMTRFVAARLVLATGLMLAGLGSVQAAENSAQLAASAGLTAAEAQSMSVDQIFAVKASREGNYNH
jgi:hypothetical protein